MPGVSTSPSPSSSPSSTSKPPKSPVIPIVVAVIAVILLVVMLLTFHFRRQHKKKISAHAAAAQGRKGREVQAGETVSRTHPAALMITPAEGKGTPRFVHTPGTNMRIATRRPDGAWEFADPRAPFTPAIIADASDAALSRNSSSASLSEPTSRPRDRSPSPVQNSPYSRSNSVPGSSSELVPPPTAASASPWGAPTTPRAADPDMPLHSPWRSVYSPAPSTSASTFLPAPSVAASSRRSSTISSNDSFLDLEPRGSTYSNPFLSPASTTPSRGARWPASPAASVRSTPEPSLTPAARDTESRAAREIRRGYDELDRSSEHSDQQPRTPRAGTSQTPSVSPEPPMTPAALAKEAESRAARLIRAGYDRVDRMSEYAEQDEGLPAY